jgi:CubicO group peptidase (beta-lactamase class C family)
MMKSLILFKISIFLFCISLVTIIEATPGGSIQRYNLSSTEKNAIQIAQHQIPQLLQHYKVPVAAVALVDKEGIIWAEGFGYANLKNKQPITPETLFSIESQTKMFTTLAILRAVQSGMVSLSEPIGHYLPNLHVSSVFQKDAIKDITLTNLLSHTAGFAHEAPVGNNFKSNANFITHMESILKGTWLQFPVGDGYNYSNVGMDLAGYILQVKSEQPYEQYVQQQVLDQLHMTASSFDIQHFLSTSDHAVGHIDGLNTVPLNYSIIPAGGLYSNVMDLSHYLQFQLNDGVYDHQQVIMPALLNTALTIPFLASGQTQGYGLGIWKGERLHTIYYSHLGRGFGFVDDLEWYPQYQLGIVVLTNKYNMDNVDIKIAHLIIDQIIKPKIKEQANQLKHAMMGQYISSMAPIEIISDAKTQQLAIKGMMNWGPAGNNLKSVYYPLNYLGNNRFYSPSSDEYYQYISECPTGVPCIQRVNDAYTWYFNQSKNMSLGPNKVEWKKYMGTYELRGYGAPMLEVISVKNGYLYFEDNRLREFSPGIFGASDGAMLIFQQDKVTWANLPLIKTKKIERIK